MCAALPDQAAEIGAYRRKRYQSRPIVGVGQPPVLDEDEAVRDLAEDVDVVRLVRVQGQKHQSPLGAQAPEEREHEPDVAVVDVELRLVEEMHERVVLPRAREQGVEHPPSKAAHLVGLVVVDRQPVAFVVSDPMDVATRAQDGARRGAITAGDQLEQGRLAGAVGAEHAHDGRLADGEVGLERKRRRSEEAKAVFLAERAYLEERSGHGQNPSSRVRSEGSSRSAAAGPLWTTRPRSSTYTRSLTARALTAFCSTTSDAMPSAFILEIVRITVWATAGASPCVGSSKSTRPGPPTRARAL